MTIAPRRIGRRARIAALVASTCLLAGCATFRPANVPVDRLDPTTGYRPERLLVKHPVGEVAFVLALSGGGTRAAALAYGVMKELRATRIPRDGETIRLLDEVDSISSVSGGSFTAAYYGLHGDRLFDDFEARFLKRDVERALLWRILSPINWFRLVTPLYDRSEMAMDYYDAEIFDEKTFAEMSSWGGPVIQINATDLSAGTRFTFIQPTFDLLCSDLSELRVSRAVTASSAVPVAFAPIALTNFAGQCGYSGPPWLDAALADRDEQPRRYHLAEEMKYYTEAKHPHYLHLVDGGIADNLGVRGPLDAVILEGGIWNRFADLGVDGPKHVVFIVVDSSTEPEQPFVSLPGAPSLASLMGSITDTQLHRYNFETKDLLFESMQHWSRDAAKNGAPVKSHLIDLAQYRIKDPEERKFFDSVPTALSLDEETVDRLIELGGQLLRDSEAFQELVADLGGEMSTSESAP